MTGICNSFLILAIVYQAALHLFSLSCSFVLPSTQINEQPASYIVFTVFKVSSKDGKVLILHTTGILIAFFTEDIIFVINLGLYSFSSK